MLKKRIKKIICFLSVVIIAFSSFIINSSAAQTSSNTFKFPISEPSLGSGDGYLEILMKDSSGHYATRVFVWHSDFTESHSSDSDVIMSVDDLSMLVTVRPSSVTFQFSFVSDFWTARASIYSISNGNNFSFGNFSSTNNGDYTYSLSSYSIVGAHIYGNGIFSVNCSNSAIGSEDFYCLYSSDVVEFNQLQSVISIITQLAENDQTIISKLQSIINNTDTIETKLQSALNLLTTIETDLDDVNAELDRIESNTDNLETQLNTIISILDNKNQQTPKPDTSTTDDYNRKEQALIGGTSAGRDEANTVFTDFNSTMSDNVGRGLLAVTAIFKEFTNISWLDTLIKFSLALGVFGFILGMGFFLVSSAAGKEARSERKEANKLRTQYYKSGIERNNSSIDYFNSRGKK